MNGLIDELGPRGRDDRAGVVAAYEIRDRDLLPDLHRGGGVEPGPLRRCSLWLPHAGRARSLEELYSRTRGEGFGLEPKRRIMLGTYVLRAGYYDAYYGQALKARSKVADDFTAAFSLCDVIVTPTSPIPAFKFGERTQDPLQMYMADVMTVAANLAGVPALSQCCGFTKADAPDRDTVIGAPLREKILSRVSRGRRLRSPHRLAQAPAPRPPGRWHMNTERIASGERELGSREPIAGGAGPSQGPGDNRIASGEAPARVLWSLCHRESAGTSPRVPETISGSRRGARSGSREPLADLGTSRGPGDNRIGVGERELRLAEAIAEARDALQGQGGFLSRIASGEKREPVAEEQQ